MYFIDPKGTLRFVVAHTILEGVVRHDGCGQEGSTVAVCVAAKLKKVSEDNVLY